MDVSAIDLPAPAITHFDLAVAGRCPVADNEMIRQPVLHSADMPMVVIKDRGVALARAAIVHDNVLPSPSRHRGAINCSAHGRREITITAAASPLTAAEESSPKTAGLLITIFFDR